MSEPREVSPNWLRVGNPRDPREPSTNRTPREMGPLLLEPCARPGRDGDWWREQHVWCTGSHHVGPGSDNEVMCSCPCHSASPAIRDETPDGLRHLPKRVIVDQHGHYWRDYGDSLSMPPVSTENNKTEVAAVYISENAPDQEATPAGDRDWPTILRWWQDLAMKQGIRAERAESLARSTGPGDTDGGLDVDVLVTILGSFRSSQYNGPVEVTPYKGESSDAYYEHRLRVAEAIAAEYARLTGSPDTSADPS